MSRPTHASTLPISDIILSRDLSSKLRLAGTVTALCPTAPLIVLSDLFPAPNHPSSSLLIDLSLCLVHGVQPPELKSKLMVIGTLTKRDVPFDLTWVGGGEGKDLSEPQVGSSVKGLEKPNKWFVMEAVLMKELDWSFDLALWNTAARMRSQNEWHHYHQRSDKKGKRKAID